MNRKVGHQTPAHKTYVAGDVFRTRAELSAAERAIDQPFTVAASVLLDLTLRRFERAVSALRPAVAHGPIRGNEFSEFPTGLCPSCGRRAS